MKKSLNLLQILRYLSVAALLFSLGSFYFHNSDYFWIEISFVIEISILTCLTRSTNMMNGGFALLNGIFLSAGATLLIAQVIGFLGFDIQNVFWSAYVFPWVEEISKLIPVLLFAYLLFKKDKVLPNISDFLFLGVMGGAGFSLFEKYFWDGISFDTTYGPHLGSVYFFPDALGTYVSGDVLGYVGHSAATGLIALGIGIGLYLKKKKKKEFRVAEQLSVKTSPSRSRFKLWWIAPLAGLLWIVLEHTLLNLYYANGSELLLLIGGGLLTPWVFLVATVVGLVLGGKLTFDFLKKYTGVKKELDSDFKKLVSHIKSGHVVVDEIMKFFRKIRFANLIGWNRYSQIKIK